MLIEDREMLLLSSCHPVMSLETEMGSEILLRAGDE